MTNKPAPNGADLAAFDRDLITRAVYNGLADGDWHDRRDIVAEAARFVPASKALRWRLPKNAEAPTGIDRTLKIATGQRDIAANRVMIHTRRNRHIEIDPTDHNRIRLKPTVAAGWRAYVARKNDA